MDLKVCVTPSGKSGHVVVPKAWIGKEAIVIIKETKGKSELFQPI